MPTLFTSRSALLFVLPPNFSAPFLANCVSNSLGLRLKGFIDELFVDFSQFTSRVHPSGEFAGLIQLISFDLPLRVFIFVPVEEKTGFFSLQPFFPAAVWPEREIFEMFGVPIRSFAETFSLDLRRLLTDYGFSGFPLRKSFPAVGFTELRYDATSNRVIEEKLSLDQLPNSRKDWFSWAPISQSKFFYSLFTFSDFELVNIV